METCRSHCLKAQMSVSIGIAIGQQFVPDDATFIVLINAQRHQQRHNTSAWFAMFTASVTCMNLNDELIRSYVPAILRNAALTWSTMTARNAAFGFAFLVLGMIACRVVADDAGVDADRRLCRTRPIMRPR